MSVGVRTEEDDEGSARHPRVSTGTASGADPASGARVTTWPAWFVLGLMGVAGVWTAGGSRAAAQECRRECSATEIQSSDACCYLPPHLAPASDCARGNLDECREQAGTPEGRALVAQVANDATNACAAGQLEACLLAGLLQRGGIGVPRDLPNARRLYSVACDGGLLRACAHLSTMLRSGSGGPVDDARAMAVAARACDSGDPSACDHLGFRYMTGAGVDVDAVRGRALMSRGCDLGSMLACWNLAVAYERGQGGPADPERQRSALARSCEGGHMPACTRLGRLIDTGRGVQADKSRAAQLYERACAVGEVSACYYLAFLLVNGPDHLHNPDRAYALLSGQCTAEHWDSCRLLAFLYLDGIGTTEDRPRARELLQQSCAHGVDLACRDLETYASSLAERPSTAPVPPVANTQPPAHATVTPPATPLTPARDPNRPADPLGRVRARRHTNDGTASREEIRRNIASRAVPHARRCIAGLGVPPSEYMLTVTFYVEADGSVDLVAVEPSRQNAQVSQCVAVGFRQIRLPTTAAGALVQFPLRF
ncbi:MAG: tetratricopeptide repeat protein [Polyangiales bacterium]